MKNPLKLPPSRVARDEKRARGGQGGMQGLRQVFRLNRQSLTGAARGANLACGELTVFTPDMFAVGASCGQNTDSRSLPRLPCLQPVVRQWSP